jgi:hypothetical protein
VRSMDGGPDSPKSSSRQKLVSKRIG